MSVKTLIWRSLKKNISNYYLYVFALIFSVALYFSFVTLQYDPAMDAAKGSIKGGASLQVGSILLIGIVLVFLLFANSIFIKRRSKEIGLFQLIGMTKSKIFRILNIENMILYFGSLLAGMFIGFSISKLIMLILIKLTGVDDIAALRFSGEALIQTIIVFSVIYLLIMLSNYLFIKKQTILSLFRVSSSTEVKVKKISKFEITIGTLGILLVGSGYYLSTKILDGDFTTSNELFGVMAYILGAVIGGTYLFYKGSVTFILNRVRKSKDGYLNVDEVLSLSSIMFRMKSNALLLTIITTVSALAIGLLSLSYISFYSTEKTAKNNIPANFSFINDKDANQFTNILHENGIAYKEKKIEVVQARINIEHILKTNLDLLDYQPDAMPMPVISDKAMDEVDLSPHEAYFTGYSDMLKNMIDFKDEGNIQLAGETITIDQEYKGLNREYVISWYFTNGGIPTVVVDESTFQRLKDDIHPAVHDASSLYIGIDIKAPKQLSVANSLFNQFVTQDDTHESRLNMSQDNKKSMGLLMFIVGFLGLTFLITSGCILYFKQMGESEDEKLNFSILRKLGFTQQDLLKGIKLKQLFNFGIPLILGLCHSYFAVKSGWFLFGTEIWAPMLLVMVLYTGFYSIFGVLSVSYYKKIIKESL